MVIDFHAHCFTDAIAASAVTRLEKQADIQSVAGGTADELRAHMRQTGVDRAVVLPVATKPSQVASINRWALEQRDGALAFFGAVHPDDADFEATVRFLAANGFRGVKLHPDYQQFFADEARMNPLYELLRDAGLTVVLHAGIDVGYPCPVRCSPLMIRHIVDRFPGLRVVAAHMGGHALWRDAEALLVGRPVYLDTSYSYYLLGKEAMERMIRRHGAENVLFGTDYPWRSAREEIPNIRSLALPAPDIDRILCGNALALLNSG